MGTAAIDRMGRPWAGMRSICLELNVSTHGELRSLSRGWGSSDLDGVEDLVEVVSVLLGGVREVRAADHEAGDVDVEDPQLMVLVGALGLVGGTLPSMI